MKIIRQRELMDYINNQTITNNYFWVSSDYDITDIETSSSIELTISKQKNLNWFSYRVL